MATQVLDLSGISANYIQTVDLDRSTFALTFRYVARADCWFLDIDDAQGVAVIHGVKLVAGAVPLASVVALNRPMGQLVVVDTTGQDKDPGIDDFGGNAPNAIVCYIEAGT